ncbi:MAG: flagellar type III secretion system pore protein FliP [bacterium]|nr:flagellar type III secretion system pore protein FliP [bacterium]
MRKNIQRYILTASAFLFLISAILLLRPNLAAAQPGAQQQGGLSIPKISISMDDSSRPKDVGTSLQILFLLTILSLAPAILMMVTSFTRIVVVLSFFRQALGTQQLPTNQIIIGLSLFLTFFVMSPVLKKINAEALQPYLSQQISQAEAWEKTITPLRGFMFRQTREKDLALFVELAKLKRPRKPDDIPTSVLIPSFIISELKTAFQIGFLIYLPFLVVDMVVSSVLLSMGMMMLPPIMISLPFKLIFFVLIDGWNLMVGSLVKSFA